MLKRLSQTIDRLRARFSGKRPAQASQTSPARRPAKRRRDQRKQKKR